MGAIVNAICIVIGASLGLLIKKGLPQRFNESIMQGIGLCVIIIGIQGEIKTDNLILMILSVVIGVIIGEALNIEKAMEDFSKTLEKLLVKDAQESQFAQGFLSAIMIFCVGSMAIVGSLESGLLGQHSTLYSKGLLDGIIAILLASTYGFGVLVSALAVLIYEGGMTLLASFLAPYLSDAVISTISAVGSALLIALGANLLEITKFRVMNFIPAVFLPILLLTILTWLGL